MCTQARGSGIGEQQPAEASGGGNGRRAHESVEDQGEVSEEKAEQGREARSPPAIAGGLFMLACVLHLISQ